MIGAKGPGHTVSYDRSPIGTRQITHASTSVYVLWLATGVHLQDKSKAGKKRDEMGLNRTAQQSTPAEEASARLAYSDEWIHRWIGRDLDARIEFPRQQPAAASPAISSIHGARLQLSMAPVLAVPVW